MFPSKLQAIYSQKALSFISTSFGSMTLIKRWCRYDARLLLDSLPQALPQDSLRTSLSPDSPTGWSDLPSDTEDTFFFAPEEAEDFRREKRRRLMDKNREERLKALRAEGGEDDGYQEEENWASDEEVCLSTFALRLMCHVRLYIHDPWRPHRAF
jgi:hypothetical protein